MRYLIGEFALYKSRCGTIWADLTKQAPDSSDTVAHLLQLNFNSRCRIRVQAQAFT